MTLSLTRAPHMRRIIVVPAVEGCLLFLRDGAVVHPLEQIEHPLQLAELVTRLNPPPREIVLAGLDASLPWVDVAANLADVLVIPEPWLANTPRAAPERRERLAARLAETHRVAQIHRCYCKPQLSLAIPF